LALDWGDTSNSGGGAGIAAGDPEGLKSFEVNENLGQSNMRKSSTTSLPSLSVRIDLDEDCRIGPGKIQLLEHIHICGSISAAGRTMEMSYKRAWNLVEEINRICRRPAVERQIGGKNGGGAILTPFGLSLVARYRKIEHSAESAAREDLLSLRADLGARAKG
jgi:molybdate transport system regulatory protein